jgi:hypothetical protein
LTAWSAILAYLCWELLPSRSFKLTLKIIHVFIIHFLMIFAYINLYPSISTFFRLMIELFFHHLITVNYQKIFNNTIIFFFIQKDQFKASGNKNNIHKIIVYPF